ncbi:MAG: Transposase DDE domain protein [Chloroflexi bacterium ADurb.Bin180]|nr:MAG: Transposase DDE domain protein [Chloroflexi bacterium ADurb.Bin180]
MYQVRQPSLFPFDDSCGQCNDNERLVLVLQALPDGKLVAWLREQRKGRQNKYPWEMLWQCLIAKYVYQIRTYAELIRELERNGSLRRLVGIESVGQVPKDYHFSRLLKLLSSEAGQEHLAAMFHQLVSELAERLPQLGEHLAVDATALHAYCDEMRKTKSDPDAAWSARPKRQRRRKGGEVEEYLDYWFGYQVHLIVDCATELPVDFEVTAANVNETTQFEPGLKRLQEQHPEVASRTEAVMADAGYDSTDNCRYVLEQYGALPIIKMRLPHGKNKDSISQAAESLCTEIGTQVCLGGNHMVYAGRDGDYLKWRCPLACGKATECQQRGRCTASAYGAVRKVSIKSDPRRYPGLWRGSKKWTRLYRKRTAAERVNGRLKDFLLLDDLTVRGKAKVTVHVNLALLVMLSGAWAMVDAGKVERARRIVALAA